MDPDGALCDRGGRNRRGLVALAAAGAASIGLSVAGAAGAIRDGGDGGRPVGAGLGALFQVRLMRGAPLRAPA